MTEQEKSIKSELENVLLDFVKRVSQGDKTTSDTEMQVLPEVASVLSSLIAPFH